MVYYFKYDFIVVINFCKGAAEKQLPLFFYTNPHFWEIKTAFQ